MSQSAATAKKPYKELVLLIALLAVIALVTRPAPPPPPSATPQELRAAEAFANDPTEEALSADNKVLFYFEFEHHLRYTFIAYRSLPDTVDLRATLKEDWNGPTDSASRQLTNEEWETFATGLRKTGIHELKVKDSYSTEPTYITVFFRDRDTSTYLQWVGPIEGADDDLLYYLGNLNAGNLCTNMLERLLHPAQEE